MSEETVSVGGREYTVADLAHTTATHARRAAEALSGPRQDVTMALGHLRLLQQHAAALAAHLTNEGARP